MAGPRGKRIILSLTGVIPAIAIAAGLLVLEPDSFVRLQYWPWLPMVTLAFGVGFSLLFWLVLARRRDSDRQD